MVLVEATALAIRSSRGGCCGRRWWPAGGRLVALEAGWITTEVGRQPWIVYRVMRVEDAVTENSGIWISLTAIVLIYTAMGVTAAKVLRSMARRWRESTDIDLPTPYGPPAGEPTESAPTQTVSS